MKILLIILTLLSSAVVTGQSPYAKLDNEFSHLFDPIPVHKGQEQQFYHYAVTLYRQDSLQKAGEIFDRVYWLDTASATGQKALQYKKQIEQLVMQKTIMNLNGVWNWGWSGTNWGETDSAKKSGKTKRIELDGTNICFYQNDTLIRQTNYSLTQTFNWQYGSLTNCIQYLDTNEKWYFNLISMGNFTSSSLWIEKVSEFVCGNFGESYTLLKPGQALTATRR